MNNVSPEGHRLAIFLADNVLIAVEEAHDFDDVTRQGILTLIATKLLVASVEP